MGLVLVMLVTKAKTNQQLTAQHPTTRGVISSERAGLYDFLLNGF